MPPKRIYMTIPRGLYGRGGIERQCQYIFDAWSQSEPDLPLVPLTTRGDSGHAVWPWVYAGAWLKFLYACAIKRDVGVIHLNAAVRASLWRKFGLALVARTFGVPIVIHLHGGGFDNAYGKMGPKGQRMTRWLFRQAQVCIVLGEYWGNFIRKTFDLAPAQVVVLMNAVPTPAVTAPRDFTVRPLHILFLGEVGERKGVHILLKALASLASRQAPGHDWRCTIAGNGNLEVFQQQARSLGLADRVTFPGWLSPAATESLLQSAQVLVLPTFAENLPMSVLEGLAHGLVVISTPVGAIPEVVQDGENGLIIPVGDVAALSSALTQVLDDPETATRLAAAARQTFAERLSLAPYCRNLAALYRRVMSAHA
jgi:glycosyltransferase involved in cell wall biosynthesis